MMDGLAFFPEDTPVVALPNWNAPRLYVAAWNLVQRWSASALFPAFRRVARFRRMLLRLQGTFIPSVRRARAGWILEKFLRMAGYPDLVPWAVLVGTPGPTQKLTVQLRGREGEVVAYLKYGETEFAKKRLANEWKVLQGLPPGFSPRPVAFGPIGPGVGILVSALPGIPLAANPVPPAMVRAYLHAIQDMPGLQVEVDEHPWVQALVKANPALESAVANLAKRSWKVVPCDGDFAPWNLVQSKGKVIAYDWEYGELQGFPAADLAYYVLQTGVLLKRWSPERAVGHAIRVLSDGTWPGLSPLEAGALVRLVAYDAYTKALEDGHSPETPLQRWRKYVWESRWSAV